MKAGRSPLSKSPGLNITCWQFAIFTLVPAAASVPPRFSQLTIFHPPHFVPKLIPDRRVSACRQHRAPLGGIEDVL
jgi:hypothetical protein